MPWLRKRATVGPVKTGFLAAAIALSLAAAEAGRAETPGVVYRTSWAGTSYFHPLGSFGKLNRAVTAGERRRAHRLASTLVARGDREGAALVWRYHARRDGPATWKSGLAQAVAAQALARAGRLQAARRAFNAIPNGLLIGLAQGPWIKLYGYSDVVVLNAQLQAALSIGHYARLADDPRARRLARAMRRATLALLPRFDTGAWSRYSLNGADATFEYHDFVTSLLWKLSRRQGGGRWHTYAARFRDYRHLPPRIRGAVRTAIVYPKPRDWYRDATEIRFRLSKPATVTFRIAGGSWRGRYAKGWNSFWWQPEETTPARPYSVWATATDRAGNATVRQLGVVTVARDTSPPQVEAELLPWNLYWHGADSESPWLRFRLRLTAAGIVRMVDLGRGDFAGSRAVAAALDPRWSVTLIATDSAGNATWVPLGRAGDAPRLGRVAATLAVRGAA
jgi:D-glucuronyl C5-epimerase C-terminus